MFRTLLRSKIHRATVTQAELDYEGSVTIDRDLLAAADIVHMERVEIYNITNGNRLCTYAIAGDPGSGVICINGAAARLVNPQDLVIICCYGEFDEGEIEPHHAIVVHVDHDNKIVDVTSK
jgi:aspartate 1-decarboxylase